MTVLVANIINKRGQIDPMALTAWLLHRAIHCGKFSCDGASGNNACRLSDALDEDANLGEVTLYLGLFGSPLT